MRSKLMDKLYGLDESIRVYNMIETLDPELNEIVQSVAYDYFWALPGLSIRDKSFVTVISLLSLKKEAQTRPHMMGFLNNGGEAKEIINVLLYLSNTLGAESSQKGLDALCEVLSKQNKSNVIQDMLNLFDLGLKKQDVFITNSRDVHIIKVVFSVAVGDMEKSKVNMRNFLKDENCSEENLRKILIHLIVYCGFPTAINGFNALKIVLDEVG